MPPLMVPQSSHSSPPTVNIFIQWAETSAFFPPWAAVIAEHIIKLNKGFFPESVAYLANFLTVPPVSQWKPSHASPWLTQLLPMVINCSHATLCNTVCGIWQEPHMPFITHHVCPRTNTPHLWHHMVEYNLYLSSQRAQFPWFESHGSASPGEPQLIWIYPV